MKAEPEEMPGPSLDVMFAVASTRIQKTPPDTSALVVRAKDSIRRPADLAGKTVSSGLVNSINYMHMQDWLQKHGVDSKTVRFLEMPFPQMADALFQNRLDAVMVVEPFLTIMMNSGNARILGHPYLEILPGMDARGSFLHRHSPRTSRRRSTGAHQTGDSRRFDLVSHCASS
jgi:hypothetical protein